MTKLVLKAESFQEISKTIVTPELKIGDSKETLDITDIAHIYERVIKTNC